MKYGADETSTVSPPAAGATDWLVKMNGRYVLRIQRKTYARAREDAQQITKALDWCHMQVLSAEKLLKDSRTRSGVRKAIRRIPYVKMPKPAAKPNPIAALIELNALLASQIRIPKLARLSLFKVTQLLCPKTT